MNIKNLSVALVTLFAASAAQAQQAVQWRVEDGGNGHWYQLRPQHPLWLEKQAEAESLGGYLATLTTPAEVNFVLSLPGFPCGANSSAAWIGLRKTATGWEWITGEPFSGTGWAGSQPCNCQEWAGLLICGTPWWGTGLADGDSPPCCAPYPSSVFEWSADCNNDGIVDYGQILQGQLVDADANGVPDVCEVDPCPGDITGGGFVDAIDLSILLASWGSTGGGEFDADVNNDGIVEGADLSIVLSGWGPCPN